MELKVIVYIIVAIAYFVINNYKKISAENRKRVFSKPVDYPPTQPSPRSAPTPSPLKNVKRPSAEVSTLKRELLLKKINKPRPKRKELTFEPTFFSETSKVPDIFLQENIKPIASKHLPKQKQIPAEWLKNAVLYGELINKPAWTIY
jgi:hypothetical protein